MSERLDKVEAWLDKGEWLCGDIRVSDVAWMVAELRRHEEDLTAAAGELMIPIPEPGTLMAKMLRANRLLIAERRAANDVLRELAPEMFEHGVPIPIREGLLRRFLYWQKNWWKPL